MSYRGGDGIDLLMAKRWIHTVNFDQIGVLLIQDHIQFSLVRLLTDYPVVCHSFYDDFFIFINSGRQRSQVTITVTACEIRQYSIFNRTNITASELLVQVSWA